MTEYNKLIYGKSNIEFITSIEVENDKAYLFREFPNGDKDIKIVPNKFWILAPYKVDNSWVKLEGDLHYKYGKQFSNREEFLNCRKRYYKNNFFSIKNSAEALMIKDGHSYFKGSKPTEVSVLSFDIESLGLVKDHTSGVLLISNTFRSPTGEVTKRLFSYDEYSDMGEMIEDWCKWVREIDPSVLVGHNIFGYDFPYLVHVASMFGKTLDLGRNESPIHIETYESKFRVDGAKELGYNKCRVWGREIIDTMFVAYRYDVGRKYENYGLKNIIRQEGLEKEDRTFYDAGQIRFKYKDPTEWAKIKEYAKDDADDSLALYDLMIPSYFYMTQSVAKTFQGMFESATGSQLNTIMMRAYLQDKHSLPKASEAEAYEGAISMGNPGVYRNAYKVDVASLYPSIMIQYEVFDSEKDPKGYFKELVSTFTKQRLHHKALAKTSKYDDDMQASLKIFINSAYGFLGTGGILFNSPKLAAFVTEKGREILTGAIDWSAENGYSLVNCDTDSVSICRGDQEFITDEERQFILDGINDLTPDKISWEDDGFYPTFIVVKAKNYLLYDGKKIKTKGSALKATTKEVALQEFLAGVLDIILHNKDMSIVQAKCVDYYNQYVREIMNISDITRWAAKKTITDKILKNERTNEAKVRAALEGSDYVEGDKIYVYFREDESLSLVENFNNDHDRPTLLKKLYKTGQTFETILPVDEIFPNYSLKKKFKILLDNPSISNVG